MYILFISVCEVTIFILHCKIIYVEYNQTENIDVKILIMLNEHLINKHNVSFSRHFIRNKKTED